MSVNSGYSITGLTILSGGSNFTADSTFNLVANDPGQGSGFAGTCSSDGDGAINSTSITSAGSNYSSGSWSNETIGSSIKTIDSQNNFGATAVSANGSLALGDFTKIETLLAAIGFLIISGLSIRKIPGAIIIGILIITLIAIFANLIEFKETGLNAIVSYPPDISPTFMKLDILGALNLGMLTVIMSFLFVNLFDTTGTLVGVATRANLLDENGEAENLDKALKADSGASIFGTFFGCSPVTSYVESSAGVEAGGRTGLTAVVVGILFILAMFLSPLASIIPAYATAGALIYVAILMLGGMEKLNWSHVTELLPALVILIMIPLTFSIADGIALGFLSYVVLKITNGEIKSIKSAAWFLTIIFISKFIFL